MSAFNILPPELEQRDGVNKWVPDFTDNSLVYRCIFDSVILITKDADIGSFFQIVLAARSLLRFGFMGTKAPLRSAIGYGDLIDNGPILIGSALEDAYAGESRQAWSGVSFTPAGLEHIEATGLIAQYDVLIDTNTAGEVNDESRHIAKRHLARYPVPIKTGHQLYGTLDTVAIDWTYGMYADAARASFEASSNPHAQTIAANTVAFEDWARSAAEQPPSR